MFLRDDIYFEPLIDKWYCWSYLLPPHTYSMYVENKHKKVLKSFISNPELHIATSQDSSVHGLHVLECSQTQIEDVVALCKQLDSQSSFSRELAGAIANLEDILRENKSGKSVDNLYKKIADALRGCVEIFYDSDNNLSYRFIEKFVYNKYKSVKSRQSVIFGAVVGNDRPFVLSSPRLPSYDNLHIDIRFDDPILTEILASRDNSISQARVKES